MNDAAIIKGKDENSICVELAGGKKIFAPTNSRAVDLLQISEPEAKYPVIAVKVDNSLHDLNVVLNRDCILEYIDLSSEEGMRIYQSGLILLLARAASDILPGCSVVMEHSLANAVYGEIKYTRSIKDSDIARIERRMRELVQADEPIQKNTMARAEAIEMFKESGQWDKVGLLEYLKSDILDIVAIGNYCDYTLGPVVPRTGLLEYFRLRYYLPGFILELPKPENPEVLPEYIEQGKLANVFFEAEKWGKVLNVHNVASLNLVLASGGTGDLIRVAEAFQEKKIVQIADQIAANIDRTRIVLIAGPSSSGKTTFAQRLAVQLRVNGITPVAISLDDYFVDRHLNPRDENGEYDFECLEAIDRALFNQHLIKLIQGEEIELPRYNFKTGLREFHGEKLMLGSRDLIIVEGIHGLNDKLTASVPKGRKFKIYVSALTHLNLDNHHRIHTTDLRIIRRMVRDYNFRGYSALDTIRRWPAVRRGEEKNIFPFQESADVMFNSALVYELSILKGYAQPLLEGITPEYPEYAEACRLLNILSFFTRIECDEVPTNSIIREFIGESCFH